jgi:Anti-sigma-K factor rskA, C-terminal
MAEEGGHAVSVHPDPESLALAALPAEPSDPGVAAHLAACAACRSHVDELARTVALAQDGVDGAGDLAGPPDRVWAGIAAELGAELQPVDDPPPPERSKARRRVLVAVAAAVVALAAGVGIGLGVGAVGGTPGAGPPATVVAQLQPIGPLDPAASGTLTATERAGVRTMAVRLTGVPDTAGADYLEVWLMNGPGTEIVALGALTRDDTGYTGSFTVPSNLPMTQLDLVDVSAERYDGNPGHSGVSILRGTLA